MNAPLWTLTMALAHFIWRTKDAVIEAMDEYRCNWREWDIDQGDSDDLDDRVWDVKPVAKLSVADLLRHPDIARLPRDGLFDPATFFPPNSPPWAGRSIPYQRFVNALHLGQIHASAILSKGKGETHQRVPYPFAIIDLRSSLNSIRKKLPAGIESRYAVRLPRSKSISAEHSDDYYDPRVPSAEVILADILASRLDYKLNSWTTEYVLGWIAYREIDRFRLLSLPNLAAAASADEERRLGVKHVHPDVELLTALRQGKLIARPSIEVMHLGYPNPIPPGWWKDRTLSEAPRLRFVKDEVIKLWTAEESASSIVARGRSTTDIASSSAATPDPWVPSTKLTRGETKVIIEAKRHWPDCKCFLRTDEVYETIIRNWDKGRLGSCVHRKTMERALRKIPAWNKRGEVNLGMQTTCQLPTDRTLK
jgi:hypothetical protein